MGAQATTGLQFGQATGTVTLDGGTGNNILVGAAANAVTLTDTSYTVGAVKFANLTNIGSAPLAAPSLNPASTSPYGSLLTGGATWTPVGPLAPATGGQIEGMAPQNNQVAGAVKP